MRSEVQVLSPRPGWHNLLRKEVSHNQVLTGVKDAGISSTHFIQFNWMVQSDRSLPEFAYRTMDWRGKLLCAHSSSTRKRLLSPSRRQASLAPGVAETNRS